MIEAYPLTWPSGWKRTPSHQRRRAAFNRKEAVYRTQSDGSQYHAFNQSRQLTISQSVERVMSELGRMGISRGNVIISTNVRTRNDGLPYSNAANPSDPGAAVYWKAGKITRCMAIDRYDRVADNLAALAATLEAMRAIERHGGAEILDRAFTGFAALPAAGQSSKPWREVLGMNANAASFDLVDARFKELCHLHHPDKGGDPEKFRQIVEAREQAKRELQGVGTHG